MAIRELEQAVKDQPIPTTLGFLAYGYGAAGRVRDADRILSQLLQLSRKQYVCPFEVATGYASIRDFDKAFEWMEKGMDARADCMAWLRTEPWLDNMRQDPRYSSLVRRIGFPVK